MYYERRNLSSSVGSGDDARFAASRAGFGLPAVVFKLPKHFGKCAEDSGARPQPSIRLSRTAGRGVKAVLTQKQYMLVIFLIAFFMCVWAQADERTPLHVGANYAATMGGYYFFKGLMREKRTPLYLVVPAVLATGLFIEALQAQERGTRLDMGDLGANALGVGLAVGTVWAFDL